MQIIEGKQQEYAAYVAINDDAYGAEVVRFGERWADLMERAMAGGVELEECAETLSHEADSEGMTGFMYGCAVQALATFWIHGERLRRWHNLDRQIGREGERANASGGVLNPALLIIP